MVRAVEQERQAERQRLIDAGACPVCLGMKFYVLDVKPGHPAFSVPQPCDCSRAQMGQRKQQSLEKLDGMRPSHRDRTFDTTKWTPNQKQSAMGLKGMAGVATGLAVLHGAPGVGKTHMLHCVTNAVRDAGQQSVYTTMPDLMEYLRQSYGKDATDVDLRWDVLIKARCLCLDEADEWRETDFSRERFLRLIDERWQKAQDRDGLTVLAMNGELDVFPPKVQSRLGTGHTYRIGGTDMRKRA